MARRAGIVLALATVVALALAAPALAGDNGEGLLGETNDKVITFLGLALVVFFPAVAVVGNAVHDWLERRRERREAGTAAHS
ncbi:MAG: hypothetical protein M3N16_03015 [Actinomycetota bacterium]|nr:hypothetical protein [Actinomycetota bacterium]